MWNRRRVLYGAAALACFRCGSKTPEGVKEVSVSLSEHLTVASVYLTEELGLFAEAGFRLNRVKLSAREAIPVLAGGKLDVAFGGVAAALMTAAANKMPIRIAAGREVVTPDCGDSFGLYVRREVFGKGPAGPEKLRGRRINVRMRAIGEYVLDTFLKQHGIPLDAVVKVDLPLNEAIAALASGRIDGLVDPEFARSPLASSGGVIKLWSLASALPGHQYSFVLFGKAMLEDVGGAARFLAAYLEGSRRFLLGETPRFMTEFAVTYGLDVVETVTACRSTFSEDGSVDLPSLERIFAWQYERGYATEPLTVHQLVDTRYLESARRMLADGSWRVNPAARGGGT